MGTNVVDELCEAGVERGSPLALVIAPSGAALAASNFVRTGLEPAPAIVRAIDDALRPRWIPSCA